MQKLYTAQTANDATKANAVSATGASRLSVHAFGTWDGATVGVYLSLNGTSNAVLLSDLTFTADGFKTIDVSEGTTIYAVTSGVGAGTTVNLWIGGIGND